MPPAIPTINTRIGGIMFSKELNNITPLLHLCYINSAMLGFHVLPFPAYPAHPSEDCS